jgi:DivIVA domain-containing protein
MGKTFPHSRRSKLGYRVDDVDEFLAAARRAYEAPPGGAAGIDSTTIRRAAFAMDKGGYSAAHVDAAMERLEDAFAAREREHGLRTGGDKAWFGTARDTAQEIRARFDRPTRHRFDRVSFLSQGYSPGEVDEFCTRLEGYFADGAPLSVDEVRTVAFSSKRRGYREWQVDLLLDSVVDVMLAVR